MAQAKDIERIFSEFANKDKRALSRLISLVENNAPERDEISQRLHPLIRGVYRIGITGPPGAGKSTLVAELVKSMRQREGEGWIGIVAVDPTSPFTGGALLGDRVRMSRLNLDSGVFIRSLATRGSMGGLATATEEVIDLMDGFGCNKVLIETIGVGQAEMDIVKSADTTLVVLVPGSGDSIQAMKAGLMEIGDIFVLNKSDREGAERAYTEIETALHFRPSDNWKVPIVRTVANRGEGIVELLTDIERHYNYLSESQRFDRQRDYRRREKILNLIAEKLNTLFWSEEKRARLDELTHQDIPISTAAEMLIENKKVRSNRD